MGQPIARREFLKTSVLLAGATGLGVPAGLLTFAEGNASTPRTEGEWRNKQSDMRYRRLGRTGYMVSEIVCGGDPISPENERHVELAIEMGLNYLDTAPAYGQGQSEMGYSQAIEGSKRHRVFLNTKVSPFIRSRVQAYRKIFTSLSADEQAAILREASEDIERRRVTVPNYLGDYYQGQFRQAEESAIANVMAKKYTAKIDGGEIYVQTIFRSVEGSLKRLKTDYLDLLMCPHGATSAAEVQIPEIFEAFEKLRREGKVRFLGVSAHTDPAGVLKGAVESGVYSMAMVAYNIVNRQYLEPVIEQAHKRDFGVIAMKAAQAVLESGRESNPIPERAALLNQSVPGEMGLYPKAYRFVLSNPHLSAVISNMVNEQMVKENLAVVRS